VAIKQKRQAIKPRHDSHRLTLLWMTLFVCNDAFLLWHKPYGQVYVRLWYAANGLCIRLRDKCL